LLGILMIPKNDDKNVGTEWGESNALMKRLSNTQWSAGPSTVLGPLMHFPVETLSMSKYA